MCLVSIKNFNGTESQWTFPSKLLARAMRYSGFFGSVQWVLLEISWMVSCTNQKERIKRFLCSFQRSSSYNHPHNDGVFVSSWFIQSIDRLASCLAIKNAVKLGWYPAIRTVRRMSYTPEVLMDGYSTITSLNTKKSPN